MKTFEGTFTVEWGTCKSKRPFTIEAEDFGACKIEMLDIKDSYKTYGDRADLAEIYGTQQYIGVPATYVTFDVHEQK